ncbi:ribosomal protein L35Ae-domain-containing protein [Mycena albidolilacea]|uniref:Ribosomal protein L35Ae-domain-containing protein n=1 Tax=Mycena albidolilacea TaxID=1033008 RepID=A0AAD6Z708_9AGAR|nr:ribosomal protein L35Ae-domain-containing protein [Mycena albidolilacea]
MRQVQHPPNTSLIQIEGVTTKEDTQFYLGKRVAYVCKAKREIQGSKVRVIWGQTGKERDDNAQPRVVLGAQSGDQCTQGRIHPQRGDVIVQHREHLHQLLHPFIPLHAAAFSASMGMLSCSTASTSVGTLHPVVPLHATVFSTLCAGEADRADPALDPKLIGIEV